MGSEANWTTILGYLPIKRELELIRTWYLNKELNFEKKGVLPKSILIYGGPNSGKTTLAYDYAKSFHFPIYSYDLREGQEDEEDMIDESDAILRLRNVFFLAWKQEQAIIILDNIDLLLRENEQFERTLKLFLDQNKENTLIIAISTDYYLTDYLENLRFDRKFLLFGIDERERTILLKKSFEELGIDYTNVDFESPEIFYALGGGDIKAIADDCYLRYGKTLTTERLNDSIYRILFDDVAYKKHKRSINYMDALYIAGKAYFHFLSKHFKFKKYKYLENERDYLHFYEDVNVYDNSLEKAWEEVTCRLGGYLTLKMIFGKNEVSFDNDGFFLKDIYERLLKRSGIYGISYFVPNNRYHRDMGFATVSSARQRRIELKKEKEIQKRMKIASHSFKKKKKVILKLADFFYEHGYLDKEHLEIILNAS